MRYYITNWQHGKSGIHRHLAVKMVADCCRLLPFVQDRSPAPPKKEVWEAGVLRPWLNEIRTLAPHGPKGIDGRFETTKTTWGKVRKSLAKRHPWLAPSFGRAADRNSDDDSGDIRASGTGRDDD